jgi:NAD(P) transhydrogenase subunit alpha
VLLVIAVMFGTINVIGGFLVTDRMLEMFKRKPDPAPAPKDDPVDSAGAGAADKKDGE